MDVKTFATLLSKELISRGIPKELAVKHAVSLVRTFDEEDLREIAAYTSAAEFEDLSDSLCDLIRDKELSGKKTDEARNPAVNLPDDDVRVATGAFPRVNKDTPSVPDTATREIPVIPKKGDSAASDAATKEIPVIPPKGQNGVPDTATKEIPIIPPVPDMATKEIPVVSQGVHSAVPDGAMREIPIVHPVPDTATKAIPVISPKSEAVIPDTVVVEIPAVGDISDDSTRSFTAIKTADASHRTDSSITMINIPIPTEEDEEELQEIYLDDVAEEEVPEKTVLTKRGRAFFWGIAIATSPLTIVASILVLALFALGIVAVCAVIVLALLLVCAEAVLGSGLTLVGVIYGAIEIVSGSPGIGIYEIGLGICCGGLALCLGILTYNLAVLGLPYILKHLLTFEGYCLKRVGPMLERFREECNRL